ncbi:MAG: hypothetical protein U0Q22_08315 [Acidimicrobiales bacterium]
MPDTPTGTAPVAAAPVQPGWVVEGTTLTLSFSATGSPAPDAVFEVSFDGWATSTVVPDATVEKVGNTTTVSVEIDAAPLSASGAQARAVFTNAFGTATSDPITLLVGTVPVAATPVDPGAVPEGTTLTLSFSATGIPAPSGIFEVSFDGWATSTVVPDATVETVGDTTTVSVEIVGAELAADGAQARGVFTNPLGTATSLPITLHVVPAV